MKTAVRHDLQQVTDYIWRLREAKNISQRRLAAKANVCYITIARVEMSDGQYSLPTLLKLCRALDITLAQLFKEIDL